MIVVAVVVCGFAVGMAALLNYFKYRSTARSHRERAPGRSSATRSRTASSPRSRAGPAVRRSRHAAGDAGTRARHRRPDSGIDVFDTEGQLLYSTDQLRLVAPGAAGLGGGGAQGRHRRLVRRRRPVTAAGISHQEQLRPDHRLPRAALFATSACASARQRGARAGGFRAWRVRRCALPGVAGAARGDAAPGRATSLRAERRLALRGRGARRRGAPRGPFGPALRRFVETVRAAETEIADLRAPHATGSEP